jgi:hypothetical protein
VIDNVYRVPSLGANFLFVPQLTHTRKKLEFWPNHFLVVNKGFVDPEDKLYKFCNFPKKCLGSTTLIT